ncbi:MAG: bifunctional metallophosphatase/5'-nucleotidase [Pseudohongiella sp.]|nr:bifunctional metallophosphatase/5'-nucleotidase [Pseudohongiella sp.]
MPKCSIITRVFLATAMLAPVAVADTQVKIIAFNDFHGNLFSAGNVADVPVGGVDVFAAYVDKLRAQNPYNVVVSAGDLIGASPLVSALFHDEPTIEVMNRLRLEFNAVGNHEFDEGTDELLRMQHGGCHPDDANTCQGAIVGTPVPFEGAQFGFLAANVVNEQTGDTLFPAYGTKAFGDHEIAFIGLTLEGTPNVVLAEGIRTLQFKDEAETINALVPEIRARGIEAIVVLIHEGGLRPTAFGEYNTCLDDIMSSDLVMPIAEIVAQLDDAVDLVITGHSPVAYNCRIPNSVGRLIPVTHAQGAASVVTDIDVLIDDASGDIVDITLKNVLVVQDESVMPVPDITRLIHAYSDLAQPLADRVIGVMSAAVTRSNDASNGQSDAGNMVADAQLAATQSPETGGAQLALMNSGGVRANMSAELYPGYITYGAIYSMQPFGNSLVTMTYTARQLKDVLEQQFPGCLGRRQRTILQVSAGFSYQFDESAPECNRIVEMSLNGTRLVQAGELLDADLPIRVTINNFIADGGDGFSTLGVGTDRLAGVLDIDALERYLERFSDGDSAYNPDADSLGKPRVLSLPLAQ